MKMNRTIMLVFLLCGYISSYGQCKYEKENEIEKQSLNWSINIQAMTKPEILMIKQSSLVGTGGLFSTGSFFINENKEYFLTLFLSRDKSQKFEIQEGQQLFISFENNINLSLISCFTSQSKLAPVGLSRSVHTYYKLTKEQIEIFTSNQIVNYKIYFSSDNDINNSFEDEKGSFFELDIKKTKQKKSLMKPAACILQFVSK